MDEIAKIEELRQSVISCLEEKIDEMELHDVAEVADIIKDMAQAEKYLEEAKYYKMSCATMEKV